MKVKLNSGTNEEEIRVKLKLTLEELSNLYRATRAVEKLLRTEWKEGEPEELNEIDEEMLSLFNEKVENFARKGDLFNEDRE